MGEWGFRQLGTSIFLDTTLGRCIYWLPWPRSGIPKFRASGQGMAFSAQASAGRLSIEGRRWRFVGMCGCTSIAVDGGVRQMHRPTANRVAMSPTGRRPMPPSNSRQGRFWEMSGERFQPLVLCAVLLVAAPMATAELITFEFAGVIDSVDDPHNLLEDSIHVGDTFAGSYTFDPDTPDSRPNDPQRGTYDSPGPTINLAMGILDILVESSNARTGVSNDYYGQDGYRVGMIQPFQLGELRILEMAISLRDLTSSALDSDVLPASPPDLASFQSRSLWVQGERDGFDDFTLRGHLTSLPEPATLSVSLIVLAHVLRRHRFI